MNAFRELTKVAVLSDLPNNGDVLFHESYFLRDPTTLGKHPRSCGETENAEGRDIVADDGVDESYYGEVYDSDDDYQISVRALMVWDYKRRGEVYLDEDVLHRQEDRSSSSMKMLAVKFALSSCSHNEKNGISKEAIL